MFPTKRINFVFCLFVCVLFVSLTSALMVKGLESEKVSGYAWSENIGWISLNSKNCDKNGNGKIDSGDSAPAGCPAIGTDVADYGVVVIDDGGGNSASLSGYAWSENIGWISFNESDLAGCPEGACQAKVDMTCPDNKCLISGWARALSAKNDPSGAGGWGGWIKLRGVNYGWYIDADGPTAGDFHGYAFGGNNDGDSAKSVIGWISANCKEGGPTGNDICAKSDYKLHVDAIFKKPIAKMVCDASSCPGGKVVCDCDSSGVCGGADWVMYQPIANPGCNFKLKNYSQGAVDYTKWEIDSSHISECMTKCDYGTIQSNIDPGNYNITLNVANHGKSDTTTHNLKVLRDAFAGFMCSLDGENWKTCSTINKNVIAGDKVYFRDDSAITIGSNYSIPSDGAAITTRQWTLSGVSIDPVSGGVTNTNSIEASSVIPASGSIVKLTIIDSEGRTDYAEYSFKTLLLPEWQEIK